MTVQRGRKINRTQRPEKKRVQPGQGTNEDPECCNA